MPPGTRVMLVDMPDDSGPPPVGTVGTVTGGNGAQVWVAWDNGSRVALLPGVDRWREVVCDHDGLGHGETCRTCLWARPSAEVEHEASLRRGLRQAVEENGGGR